MGFAGFGRELRLEQGRNIETVSGGLDGAYLALRAAGHYGKARFHGSPFIVGIDFEVAEEFFGDRVLRIERLQVRAGAQANFRDRAYELGGALCAIRDGASDRIDDDVLRSGIVLGAIGIFDPQDVADALDERVLKAAAGSEEGPVAPAGEFDALQHAVKTFVGTAWRCPESVKALQSFLCVGLEDARSCDPLRFDG